MVRRPEPEFGTVRLLVLVMAVSKIVIGLLATLAPRTSLRALGLPPEHDNPSARIASGMFGVRDVAAGLELLRAVDDVSAVCYQLPMNLAIELGDAAVLLAAAARRDGIERPATRGALVALAAAASWIWIASRRNDIG